MAHKPGKLPHHGLLPGYLMTSTKIKLQVRLHLYQVYLRAEPKPGEENNVMYLYTNQ